MSSQGWNTLNIWPWSNNKVWVSRVKRGGLPDMRLGTRGIPGRRHSHHRHELLRSRSGPRRPRPGRRRWRPELVRRQLQGKAPGCLPARGASAMGSAEWGPSAAECPGLQGLLPLQQGPSAAPDDRLHNSRVGVSLPQYSSIAGRACRMQLSLCIANVWCTQRAVKAFRTILLRELLL